MSNHPSAAELAIECRRLISQLERHRLNVSLLRRAQAMLLLLTEYKQNRVFRPWAKNVRPKRG